MALEPTFPVPVASPAALPVSRPDDWEVCELCGAGISREHPHLIDPAGERVLCACAVCARLFAERAGARFKRIPEQARQLVDLTLDDDDWRELALPIRLAFLVRRSTTGEVVAIHPGSSGVVESRLSRAAWETLLARSAALASLAPDVEALVVTDLARPAGTRPPALIAPIDACYRLADLLDRHWHGPSGGPEVWSHLDRAFAELLSEAEPSRA